jgi:hypothetical protein
VRADGRWRDLALRDGKYALPPTPDEARIAAVVLEALDAFPPTRRLRELPAGSMSRAAAACAPTWSANATWSASARRRGRAGAGLDGARCGGRAVATLTPPSRAYRYGVVVSDGQRTGSRVVSWHRTRAFAVRAGVRYLDRHGTTG